MKNNHSNYFFNLSGWKRLIKIFPLLIVFLFLSVWQIFSQNLEVNETIDARKDVSSSKNAYKSTKNDIDKHNVDKIKISKGFHIHNMSINNKPCMTVKDGSRLIFECWDALEGKSRFYFDNNISYNDERRKGTGNPATGPVFIEGALPGDVLEVEIHDIRLSKNGYMQNINKNQFIEGAEREYVYIEVEVIDDHMIYNGKKMPIHPMVGVMGTAGFIEMTTGEVWDNGGNMDTRIVTKKSKVLLPVFVEGALLAMGDCHATQGDGEVLYKGVEIGAEIEVTVRIRKDLKIQRPMVINPDRIATIASDPDIMRAKNMAISDMGRYLVNVYRFSSIDASSIIGFYGNLRFGQVANPQKTVRMEIKKKYIKFFL